MFIGSIENVARDVYLIISGISFIEWIPNLVTVSLKRIWPAVLASATQSLPSPYPVSRLVLYYYIIYRVVELVNITIRNTENTIMGNSEIVNGTREYCKNMFLTGFKPYFLRENIVLSYWKYFTENIVLSSDSNFFDWICIFISTLYLSRDGKSIKIWPEYKFCEL